jgi:hypothetical protein
MSTNAACANCKPTAVVEDNNIVPDICRNLYNNVTSCMTLRNGSISECKVEWTAFRKCFNKSKTQKLVGSLRPPPAESAACDAVQESSSFCDKR